MWYLQCFDNWTARGCKDLDHLLRHAEQMYSVVENGIDYSLVQPFEGEEDADYSLVTSMDQITPAMEREFQKAGEEWLYIAGIHTGSKAKGVVVDKVEYAGLALAVSYNKSMNRVYVIYKLDVTDQNQTDPVSRSVYWYVGLSGIYEGGEIQTASCEDTAHDVWSLADWVDDLATIDDLRECIQHRECSGWSYEDNF